MLTFEQFQDQMSKLKVLFEKDAKVNDFIREMTFDGYGFFFGDAINQIIDLLILLMDDNPQDSLIEYFVYDLDFGKDWQVGMVTERKPGTQIPDKDKVYEPDDVYLEPEEIDIPLGTVEDLYKELVVCHNKRIQKENSNG